MIVLIMNNAKLIINEEQVIYTKWNNSICETFIRNNITPKKLYNQYGKVVPLNVPIKGTIKLWSSPSKINCPESDQEPCIPYLHHRK
jgi:hypothetical protein